MPEFHSGGHCNALALTQEQMKEVLTELRACSKLSAQIITGLQRCYRAVAADSENSAQNAIAIAEVLREESALRIVDWDYDIINRAEMLLRANQAAAAKNESRLKHN
jgi:hypothetical protein